MSPRRRKKMILLDQGETEEDGTFRSAEEDHFQIGAHRKPPPGAPDAFLTVLACQDGRFA
jgi:hypothetical protein